MSTISTHVLDTGTGSPAEGVTARLEHPGPDGAQPLGTGVTNADGRIADFGAGNLPAGTYRLVFDTGAYFASAGRATFFPEVSVTFAVADESQHYHIPLLLSPFSYTTYRGS
ncbi:hydroxyisourate hydrolase [Haloechinothrix sp. LS1_15]|uniref:hydroxyisourate hydrolase n=1 Tax=Haloechinothrix sp. LS1_15 TaxID=2652248 RepID=UPI00294479E7|nr:hydroxyisourate hydrolase [Haloechinothrix sp. LS1_15]MDV6012839.1 hydroxyisourate hydrolase [Haloechinothrix sp. LS1_15]